jgi:hypothetical protein
MAFSQKRTSEPLLPDGPLAEVGLILERFDKLVAVMAETHQSIPAALAEERKLAAEAGAAAITGSANGAPAKLAAVIMRRESEVRRRSAAVQAILDAEPVLAGAAALVSQQQRELAAAIIREFSVRWQATCDALAALRAEASALGAALAHPVLTPAPYAISRSVAHDRHELHPIARAEPFTVTLSPELIAIQTTADRLNKAIVLCSGIERCREWDARHFALAQQRGEPTQHRGVYVVQQAFRCPMDAQEFARGSLIDRSLLSDGFLSRLLAARTVRPVELSAAGVAA